MDEQPQPSNLKNIGYAVVAVLVILIIAAGVRMFTKNKQTVNQNTNQQNTQQSTTAGSPPGSVSSYSLQGIASNINTGEFTLSMSAYVGSKLSTKQYSVAVTSATIFKKFMGSPQKGVSISAAKFSDIKANSKVQVTTKDDPSKSSKLSATEVDIVNY